MVAFLTELLHAIDETSQTKPTKHYENTPIQYTVIFNGCKNDYFQMKNYDIFLIFVQNIDRGYRLEPEAVLTSTHYLCFRAKIRKNVYPCKPQFYYIEVGCKGVYITRTCNHDVTIEAIGSCLYISIV